MILGEHLAVKLYLEPGTKIYFYSFEASGISFYLRRQTDKGAISQTSHPN
jgi:hypothetical protein